MIAEFVVRGRSIDRDSTQRFVCMFLSFKALLDASVGILSLGLYFGHIIWLLSPEKFINFKNTKVTVHIFSKPGAHPKSFVDTPCT